MSTAGLELAVIESYEAVEASKVFSKKGFLWPKEIGRKLHYVGQAL